MCVVRGLLCAVKVRYGVGDKGMVCDVGMCHAVAWPENEEGVILDDHLGAKRQVKFLWPCPLP